MVPSQLNIISTFGVYSRFHQIESENPRKSKENHWNPRELEHCETMMIIGNPEEPSGITLESYGTVESPRKHKGL